MRVNWSVFDVDSCTCASFGCHAGPSAHDDGFGCTNEDCGCVAGWVSGVPL